MLHAHIRQECGWGFACYFFKMCADVIFRISAFMQKFGKIQATVLKIFYNFPSDFSDRCTHGILNIHVLHNKQKIRIYKCGNIVVTPEAVFVQKVCQSIPFPILVVRQNNGGSDCNTGMNIAIYINTPKENDAYGEDKNGILLHCLR